nr:hypothetical protein FFPRI1PSEUD_44430 [Pseudomonas sp. FFPRI_1]
MLDTDDESFKKALHNTIGAIQGEFGIKAEGIVKRRRNVESDIPAIDAEIDRLNELKRIKNNKVETLNELLRRNMEAAEIKSIKWPLFTITLALAPEKVIMDKEEDIPHDFLSTKTVFTPDKKAIAASLKDIRDHNEVVRKRIAAGEGAVAELLEEPIWSHLERGESSIRIK